MRTKAKRPFPRPARLPAWSWIIIVPLVSWLALFLGFVLIFVLPSAKLGLFNPAGGETAPEADTPIRVIKAHSGWVTGVAYSPDGTMLASVGEEPAGRLKMWRVADGSPVYSVDAHNGGASSVAFSPDGKILATGGKDGLVRLWNSADGSHLRDLTGSIEDVISVAFSPDGQTVAAGSWGRAWLNRVDTVHLWRVADGTTLLKLDGNPRVATAVDFSPDGQYLAASGDDRVGTPGVYIWHLPDGRLVHTMDIVTSWALKFMPDSTGDDSKSTLAVAAGPVSFVSVPDGAVTGTAFPEAWTSGQVLAVSPDGRLLATGWNDHVIKLWLVAEDRELNTFSSDDMWVQCLALSPDGKIVASGALDGAVRLWQVPALADK